MNHSEKQILCWIKYILQLLSITIFSYILIAHLFQLIKPTEAYIDFKVFNLPYLRFILFLGFLSGLVGWSISLFIGEITLISPFSQKLEEKIILASTAFFLAVFYNGLFGFLRVLQYPVFILMIILFYVFIPQLVEFYSRFSYSDLKSLIRQTLRFDRQLLPSKKHITIKSFQYLGIVIFILLSSLIAIFSFIFVSKIVGDYMLGKVYKENQLSRQFYISKITPQKVVNSQKVKLEGNNFGWKSADDLRYQIRINDTPVRLIDGWTNEQLEFTVSLDIPLGKKQLWVEKPLDNTKNNNILRSNVVGLDVIDRFVFYPAVGDTFITKVIKRIKKILFFDIKIFNSYLF